MAITICGDSLVIGSYSISQTATGIKVDGGVFANNFTDCTPIPPIQGTTAGYFLYGGTIPAFGGPYSFYASKFPFASENSSSYTGPASPYCTRYSHAFSDGSCGFAAGGQQHPTFPNNACVRKFPFASDTSFSAAGTLVAGIRAGSRSQDTTAGYIVEGDQSPQSTSGPPGNDKIVKFTFASTVVSTCIASNPLHNTPDQTINYASEGLSDAIGGNGYSTGGFDYSGPAPQGCQGPRDWFRKFPFASGTPYVSAGSLSQRRAQHAGTQNDEKGYVGFGQIMPYPGSNYTDDLDRVPFATDSWSANIATLASARGGKPSGAGSTTCGYMGGGYNEQNGSGFSFASESPTVTTFPTLLPHRLAYTSGTQN